MTTGSPRQPPTGESNLTALPLVQVAAMLQLDLLAAHDLPMLAAHWVAAGLGGEVLAELAGLGARDREADDLWPAAAGEVGLVLPVAHARRQVMAWAASQVTDGHRDPRWLLRVLWPGSGDPEDVDEEVDRLVYCLHDILEWAPAALEGRTRDGRPDPEAPDRERVRAARRALHAFETAARAMGEGDLRAALDSLT